MRTKLTWVVITMAWSILLGAGSAAAQAGPSSTVIGTAAATAPALTPDLTGPLYGGWTIYPPPEGPGRIHLGKLQVILSLSIREYYDDNIFLGNGDSDRNEREIADFMTQISPGVRLNYTMPGRGSIDFGYRGDFALYADETDNDWNRHLLDYLVNYKAPMGLIFVSRNAFERSQDPYGSIDQFDLGRRTERWYDYLRNKVGYEFSGRFRVFGFCDYYRQDYDLTEDFTQDYDFHEFGIGPEVRIFPKTWAFARYYYGVKDYFSQGRVGGLRVDEDNDPDSTWHRLAMGLTWDPAAKLSGEIEFGYQWRNYANDQDVDGDSYEDKGLFVVSTALNFLPTPNSRLVLNAVRALRDSGADTVERYEDTGVGLNLSHAFFTKFTAGLGCGYSRNDYNLPDDDRRHDDNYSFNIGLDYQIRDWLRTSIGYFLLVKDSNYHEFDFTDNRFMVELALLY